MRGQHDLGGLPAGPLDLAEQEAPPFGKLFTALLSALRQHDLVTIDELRRAMEELSPDLYDKPYFERWGEALCVLLEEKDILTRAQIDQRMTLIKQQDE